MIIAILGTFEQGRLRVICGWNVFGCGSQFQGGSEVGADAGGFFGGGDHPLIEGVAYGAALGLVFDDDEADEVAAESQAVVHGIAALEHAVEDEGHVVVFEELGDGEHAAGVLTSVVSVNHRKSLSG